MRKFFAVIALTFLAAITIPAQTNLDYQRTEDVIYGRKFGMALTMDVFQPKQPNGAAVILAVSGGWFSSHDAISPAACKPFLDRGYTVFAVVHGSQPKFVIPEVIQDMHRAVRFIRHNAKRFGVDPNKFGISGGSAGGHLSLTIGTQGGPGDPKAKDPVDRESSAVQCVACFFPPTDFLNYGQPGEDGAGVGTLKNFKSAFGPRSDNPDERKILAREISPIYYITSKMPPTLIFHGNADPLVPIQQSETFVAKAKEAGATAKLIIKEGAGHGWANWLTTDMGTCAEWFDEHLRGIKKENLQPK